MHDAGMIPRIEELSMNAWPALQTVLHEGWALRFAEGHTKRANSVHPLYAAAPVSGAAAAGADALERRIDFCETLYRARGLPVIFKLPDTPANRALEAALEKRGYGIADDTSVRTLDNLPPFGGDSRFRARDRFGDEWIGASLRLGDVDPARHETFRRMLANASVGVVAATVELDGAIIAAGFGAIEEDWCGLFDIVVGSEWRGKGYGELLVRGILGEARSRGARRSYLQVVCDNAPAIGLYDKLGYAERYRYRYRKKA